MSNTNTETYYIVSVKLREVKAFNGDIITREGTEGWLGEDSEYPSIYTNKRWAKKFTKPLKKSEVASYDGMPWFHRIIPGSVIIHEIAVTKVEPIVEEKIIDRY